MRFVIKYHRIPWDRAEYDDEKIVDSLEDAARHEPMSVLTFPGGEEVPLCIVQDIRLASKLHDRLELLEIYKRQYEARVSEVSKMREAATRVDEYQSSSPYFRRPDAD